MILTDAIGNPLQKDDLVVIQRGDQWLVGVVVDIKEPSVLAAGTKDAMQMIGIIRFGVLPITISFDIHNPHLADCIKIVKPLNFGKQNS